MTKIPLYIYVVLILFAILQTIFYYPQLPDTVVSHFDGSGRPNGWSFKETFFIIYFGALLIITGIFFLLPPLMRYVPISMITLPNKNYWLTEERREETFNFFRQKMPWLGVANAMLAIGAVELAIDANLNPKESFSSSTMWRLLGAYLVYLLIWIITFFTRFKKPA